MKKKALSRSSQKTSSSTSASRAGLDSLVVEVRSLVHSARHAAATAVNTLQVQTNFEIGRRIVEHEQQGTKRASYGTELLNGLSAELTQEFGSGFSATNLKLMRQFFVEYSGRIGQTLSDESFPRRRIGQTVSDQSVKPKGLRAKSSNATNRFTLSWSHYVLLLTISDDNERRFYEIEATTENWSLRELKR
ncbi:MAG: hypothetical protein JWM11_5225 [Planctomycetaceae bacterium]|nr:hypothetical protein [Planctomycetaceae bacterium]